MSKETLNWWDKPTLYTWDGTLILLRMQMWCDLCWAACMDGADAQTNRQRRQERLEEAAEWREAYRVLADIVKPRAKRA